MLVGRLVRSFAWRFTNCEVPWLSPLPHDGYRWTWVVPLSENGSDLVARLASSPSMVSSVTPSVLPISPSSP